MSRSNLFHFTTFCHAELVEAPSQIPSLRGTKQSLLLLKLPSALACLGSPPPRGSFFWLGPKETKTQGLHLMSAMLIETLLRQHKPDEESGGCAALFHLALKFVHQFQWPILPSFAMPGSMVHHPVLPFNIHQPSLRGLGMSEPKQSLSFHNLAVMLSLSKHLHTSHLQYSLAVIARPGYERAEAISSIQKACSMNNG